MEPPVLSAEVVHQLTETLEHFNGNHADTILLLARHGAGCPEATDAEAVGVDALGIDFAVRTPAGDGTARLVFEQPAAGYADVQAQFLARVAQARVDAGPEGGLTSLERELQTNRTLPTFVTEVIAFRRLAPNLVEIEFERGFDGFQSLGGDQFLYLMVARPGGEAIPADHTMAEQMAADPDAAPDAAYYTVRRWDPDAGRMTMWAVLHGHDEGVGGWAGRCRIGERVAMWGPREGMGARPDARAHLFVADESGFAAVAALLDELPADAVGRAILETVDADHVVDLPERPGVEVTWLFRHGEPAGVTNRLLEAVVDLDLDPAGLVAFGAAESRQITAVRKHLRTSLAMRAQDVYMTGYWRRAKD